MLVLIQNFVVKWKLFYFYSAFLVLLSVLPINSSDSSINHVFVVSIRLDYLLHCLVYIPLVFFACIDKELNALRLPFKTFGWVIVIFTFAIVTEWVQFFLPYRAFNINDLIANALGVLIGFLIITIGLFKPFRLNQQ
jgi:VanZ family protein